MTQLTKLAFNTLYNSSGSGAFLNNSSQAIVESTMRQFAADIKDSVLFIGDNINTDLNYFEQNDFLDIGGVNDADAFGFGNYFSGAGAIGCQGSTYGISTYHCFGSIEQSTGTTNAGVATIMKTAQSFFGNGHTLLFQGRAALQQLSNGTDRFTINIGFGDNHTISNPNNCAFFKYCDNVNSGKWQCITGNGGVFTTTDSGITADTGYHIFGISVNSSGSSIGFYVDGVLVQTITTNIPTANAIGVVFNIIKSVGTTAVKMAEDWYSLLITRTTSR